ncbi:hypothetical protein JRQ81_012272 [Phrynocephalus forsythii]|uniref:BING4 C-terminal domain-containing protein n=1 Tax=Phrynocephalus forsythii TaxID=171643 RepID=A0A9Q1APZ7_9SAUR|nr:hypothetical protein JRQ81_012272 [Phrynocephalus forsythii]
MGPNEIQNEIADSHVKTFKALIVLRVFGGRLPLVRPKSEKPLTKTEESGLLEAIHFLMSLWTASGSGGGGDTQNQTPAQYFLPFLKNIQSIEGSGTSPSTGCRRLSLFDWGAAPTPPKAFETQAGPSEGLETQVIFPLVLSHCRYMATSGLDRKLHIYDLRAYRRLHSLLLPTGAGHLDFSQRGLLGAACQEVVQVSSSGRLGGVYVSGVQGHLGGAPSSPTTCHSLPRPAHGLRFCPFEDVLGVGHEEGFVSLLVPGAGEPNFDALESNPFRSKKQRQEWEVKALLEKIPAELISLDPGQLGAVDAISLEQRHKERVERLGFDPQAKKKFIPRKRMKGRDSASGRLRRKTKVAAEEQRTAIRKSVAEKLEAQKQQEKAAKGAAPGGQRSALDRFKK